MSNNDLVDSLRKSFEYWSKVDEDSLLNCELVWKKILSENSEFLKNQTILINNSRQNAGIQIEQFLESWAHAIEEPNFEGARNSIKKWNDFLEQTTKENASIYSKVLELLETSWENMQSKNIE